MSAFINNLVNGRWALSCANGQYIGTDPSQADPSGNPYLVPVSTRRTAAFLQFTVVETVSPTNITVTISVPALGRYLALDSNGYLVFAALSGTATRFSTIATRSTQVQIGRAITSIGGQSMTFDPAVNRFSLVNNASGPDSRFGLAPSLPAGALLWSTGSASALVGTPYVYAGAVFAVDQGTLVNCHDLLTGATVWEAGAGLSATCPVEVNYAHALVFSGDSTGLLHAFDLDSGAAAWTFQSSAPVYARPSAYVDTLFIPSSDGVLYAVATATGVKRWQYPASGNVTGIFSAPQVAANRAFFGAWDNQVHAVDTGTGLSLWSYQAGGKVNGGISLDASSLYVGTDTNQLLALDQADGTERWSLAMAGIVSGAPVVDSGRVYGGSFGGDFVCVDASAGTVIWRRNLDAPIPSSPALADGVLYFTTLAGTLYALDATSGATRASYELGATANGSPIALSGAIYTSAGSKLFTLSEGLAAGFNPSDMLALLMLSSWSNTSGGKLPSFGQLPAGWQSLQAFISPGITFASGGVTRLLMPGTDQSVVALTFGTNIDGFPTYLDTSSSGLVPLPLSIGGSAAPDGLMVNATVLASYLAVRATILAALSGSGQEHVRIAGIGGGGTLALLAALDLATPSGKAGMPSITSLDVTAFGSPPVGNQAFATYFALAVPACRRIQNVGDTTQGLLPVALGYVPAGQVTTIGADGVTNSSAIDPGSFLGYRIGLVGR
ncbi:MAG: PQQ-binding-like beta-propeller repeat protein [Massilia sp.]